MKRVLTFLIPLAVASAMSLASISSAQAAPAGSGYSPLPGIELVNHRSWNQRPGIPPEEGGPNYNNDNWDNQNWRHRHHHRHHHNQQFPGIGFSFGFVPQYYSPPQDCFRDQWGRLYCSAY